jgi:16S rRNA processing protein RimM
VKQTDWVIVGRLKRTRGNRGELIAEIYSPQPGRAEKLKEVMLDAEGRQRLAEVEQFWTHDGRPVFKFVGIDSITDAEVWQGADILAPEAQRAVPAEGEYTHADLTGCRMVAEKAPDVLIGVVRGVEEFGGPPLLRVETAEGREILVPFARSICREIDVAAKLIRVELPEGLLELP